MSLFKYIIEVSDADGQCSMKIASKGTSSSRRVLHASILLASDKNGKRYMTVAEIAEVYHTTPTAVQNVCTSYSEKSLDATISRKKRETPPMPAKITWDVEARVIALACGNPPKGYSKWTLWLLTNQTVELGYVDAISHAFISSILKK